MKKAGLNKSALLGLMAIILGSCGLREEPNFTYMPDMAYSPALKAQEEGAMRTPPAGTVSTTQQRYLPKDIEEAGRTLKNPLPRSRKVLLRGKDQYAVYCGVCHGPMGDGDGSIVPKFQRPPPLTSDKINGYSDGKIFHVITTGQNNMPSYAAQVDPKDRWAIIHYLRVIQRAKNPTAADLEALKNW